MHNSYSSSRPDAISSSDHPVLFGHATPVSPTHWDRFLDLTVPRADNQGHPLTVRSLTMADTKRGTLKKLYADDPRVSPS